MNNAFKVLSILALLLIVMPYVFAQKVMPYPYSESYFYISAKNKFILGEPIIVNACGNGLVTLDIYYFESPIKMLEQGIVYGYNYESLIKEKKPVKTITEQLGIENKACKEINLNLNFPGFFVVKGRNDVTQETQVIAFTIEGLALLLKTDNEKNVAWVINTSDGKPVENAEIKLYTFAFESMPAPLNETQKEKPLTSITTFGFTNSSGLLEFNVPEIKESQQNIIVAEKNNAIAFVYHYRYYTEQQEQLKAYGFTDKPIYRPNQTVYIKAILWNNTEKKAVSGRTVKLIVNDPKGNTVLERELWTNEFGSISTDFVLSDEPALGIYTIQVKIQDKEYTIYAGAFEVQEYLKPEFFVEINPEKSVFITGEKALIEVKALYFFGSAVSNAKVLYKVYSQTYIRPCQGYWRCVYLESIIPPKPPYSSGELIREGELTTNSEGKAFIELDIKEEENKKYYIEAKVIDKSNREITTSSYITVASAEFQLFVRGTKHAFFESEQVSLIIEAKDFSLKPVTTNAKLKVYKTEWNADKGAYEKTLITTTQIEIKEGKAMHSLSLSAGSYSIEVTAKDSKERTVTGEGSIYVSSETMPETIQEMIAELDKDIYVVGDNAILSLKLPKKNFTAFISIEGRKLYKYDVVSITENSAVFNIQITEDYQPNAFIHITGIQDKKVFFKELTLNVPPREKKLDLEMSVDKSVYLPREKVHLTVKTTNLGKPVKAELALSVVDESIYSLKEDNKEDIFKYFFAPEYNRVISRWSIDYYGLPVYRDLSVSKTVEQREGQPEDKALIKPMIRRLFADTAFWTALVQTNDAGIAEIEFELPDNLTTWRATVVASNESKVGLSSFKFLESKNLIARLITPRFFTQGDTSKVIAIVNSNLSEMKNIKFELSGEGIEITGSNTAEVTVATGQSESFEFNVKATECCSAKLTLNALTDIESDAIEVIVPVLPFGIKKTKAFVNEVERQAIEQIVFPENTVENADKIKINIMPTIAGGILQSLEYLSGYPYGCVEQTMSRFLPDIIVWNALKKLNLKNEKLEEKLPDMVSQGLQRLYNYQAADGGWGWWQYDESHPFMTAYVMYGLTLAKSLNFDVDKQVFEKGLTALQSMHSKAEDNETKAFIAYVLKLNGYSEYMNRLEPEFDNLSSYGKALFVLSKDEKVESYLEKLLNEANCNEIFCSWKGKSWHYSWNENEIEPTAWALKALLKVRPSDEKVTKAVKWLMSKRRDNYWISTKDTAATLFALTDYLKYSNELNPNYTARVYVNNELLKEFTVNSENFLSINGALLIENPAKNNEITVEKTGEGKLYYSILQEYFDKADVIKAENHGIEVKREISKTALKIGEEAEVTLTIKPLSQLDYVLLEDYLPAGITVIEEKQRFYPMLYYDCFECYNYQRFERRDEKVVFFFTQLNAEVTVSYKIRAELPGTYKVLPARAELMYAPEIHGFTSDDLLTVTEETSFSLPTIKVLPNEIIVKPYPIDEQTTVTLEVTDMQGKTIALTTSAAKEVSIPLTVKLSDGQYKVNYLISSKTKKFSGSKIIQQGFIEPKAFKLENIPTENELLLVKPEVSTTGTPLFAKDLAIQAVMPEKQFNFLLVAAVIIIVIAIIVLIRYWIKNT